LRKKQLLPLQRLKESDLNRKLLQRLKE
jgi:hypothetical protein